MKNLYAIAFLLIFSFSYTQLKVLENKDQMIEVGKVGPMGTINILLNKTEDNKIYCFEYQDMKFKQLTSWKKFCFINENDDITNLYNLILDGFEKNIDNEIKLESQLHYIYLQFEKHLGVMNFNFKAEDKNSGVTGYSRYMTKKQVMKLFGIAK